MQHSLKHEIWRASRRESGLALRVFSVLAIALIANVLTPWPFKFIIDEVLAKGSLCGLSFVSFSPLGSTTLLIAVLTIANFGLIVLRGFYNHRRHVLLTRLVNHAADHLRLEVFTQLLKSDLTHLSHFAIDDLRARVNEDIEQVRDCIVEVFAALAGELLTIVVTFAILFAVDPTFACLAMLFFSLLFVIYRRYPQLTDARNTLARTLSQFRNTFTGEIIRNQLFVKAWAREEQEIKRLAELNERCSEADIAKAQGEARLIFFVELLTALMTASILGYGGWSVATHRLSLGGLVLFMQYLAFLYAPIGRMSGFLLVYQKGRVGWQRIQEVFSLPHEALNFSEASVGTAKTHAIEFDRVSFSYTEGQPVFTDFEAHVPFGSIAVITGPSGIGKSTLLKMAMGFHLPASGEVRIEGRSLRNLSALDLRGTVAYVDQESTLLSGTIRDNLLYGCDLDDGELRSFHDRRLRDICRTLGIDGFIANLPQGYETEIRSGTTNFSTGQRQRLALARALISDRRIVLMDEPTSALDPALELDLLPKIQKLLKGKTAIIITHRTQPLEIADLVLNLDSQSRFLT